MTDLHTPSDSATTVAPDPTADTANHRTFRAATLDEAVAAARSELGPEVELVEAHRVRRGGLGGFFATDLGVEIVAAPGRRRPASRPAATPSRPTPSTPTPPPPTRAEREEPRIATGIDRLIERVESAEMGDAAGITDAAAADAATSANSAPTSAATREALAGAIAEAIGGSHPFDEQMRSELGASAPTPSQSPTAADRMTDETVIDRREVPIPPLVDPLSTLDDELAQATTPSPRSTIEELDDALARHADRPGVDHGSPVDDAFEALDPAGIDHVTAPRGATADIVDTVPDEDVILDDAAPVPGEIDELDTAADPGADDAEIEAEVIGPDEGEWAPGEAALRQRKKELDRTLGALEEIDDLLRDVGVNVPARTEAVGTALVRAEPAPVEEIARVATSQLVEGIAALDDRCTSEIRRVSVSVTGADGTTVCMSTELGDRRG